MNKAKLKAYAPAARQDFIRMVRQRADLLGLTKKEITPARVEGEISIIEGRAYNNKNYAALHSRLAKKIEIEGLDGFIERIAYSWFNRFAALRFMELNGFLSHGYRVLSNSNADKSEPEILTHAAEIQLPGLDKEKVIQLKLAGNKDAELYKTLIVAQCNELHRAMPFLFERINDESEMLLPDNLLATDSVIRKMVSAIDEADWQEVEIIGWLYQFYISEKKDEVIGKTVKSEDIPAATQLFTPNWIVKYMTQNSLGRLWLENNPQSALAQNMEFYIKPAEENSNPKSEIQNPKSALSPEEIRVLDPACGSGHILVEAYELLKAIYTERGYSSRDIPLLILEKNLFGLDIDERAAQMASFALLMKARRDDRRIFEKINSLNDGQIQTPKSQIPNITVVPDSSHLKADEIAEMFFSDEEQSSAAGVPIRDSSFLFSEMETQPSLMIDSSDQSKIQNPKSKIEVSETNVTDLLSLFEQGKTLGSLIRIPHGFGAVIEKLEKATQAKRRQGNFLEQVAARELEPFVRAAKMLANKYDCVIANPPYMGGKGMNGELKAFAAKNFPDSKSDLFAMFIERNLEFANERGQLGFMSPFVWMFISSYEKLRDILINDATITSLVQLEYSGFAEATVPICTFTLAKKHMPNAVGSFIRLSDFRGHQNQAPKTLEAIQNPDCGWFYNTKPDDFKKIPGSPIAYWVSDKVREVFEEGKSIMDSFSVNPGIRTGKDEWFLRYWFEISREKTQFDLTSSDQMNPNSKWFPLHKGGDFRKWYGNAEHVIDLFEEGINIKTKSPDFRLREKTFYFKPHVSWSRISSSSIAFRYFSNGVLFSDAGPGVFANDECLKVIPLLNSKLGNLFLKIINPTLNYQKQDIELIPYVCIEKCASIAEQAVAIARADWDSFETSWDFSRFPILDFGFWIEEKGEKPASVEEAYNFWEELTEQRIGRMQELETENNRLFIEAYGLEDELSPEVPLEQITLARADAEKDTRRLLSYFIGCLMGRYSLDEKGLIYADAGGKGFDPSRYQTFPADDDGIVPVTDMEWFPQEAARQFEKFIVVAFGNLNRRGAETQREEFEKNKENDLDEINQSDLTPRLRVSAVNNLSENLRWIADQLGAKANETALETIRRYFSTSFFKDHMQTYKKRPIYWLFSSGKQKAFECLVYLHRYNEQTLARMRHQYVLPLMSKFSAQVETLDQLIEAAETTAERNRLQKQLEVFKKKQHELSEFDENLRHFSDMKVNLDLDDGVKVNYGKFGDLLADVKKIAK